MGVFGTNNGTGLHSLDINRVLEFDAMNEDHIYICNRRFMKGFVVLALVLLQQIYWCGATLVPRGSR